MIEIQRYDHDKVWGIEKHELGDYVQYDDHAAIVTQLNERNSGLEAARIAYASEFPLSSEGEPDVGSIHQNIRKLKADYAQLEADLAQANEVKHECNEKSQAQQPTLSNIKTAEERFSEWRSHTDKSISAGTYGTSKMKEFLANEINELRAVLQPQAQQTESQWKPIATAPKNKKIIVLYKNVCGKDRTIFAKYIEEFTEEANSETECETDYHEERDTYYFKEGWVEMIDNWDEFSCVYFDSRNVPTHWMDIPPAPEGGDK